MYARGHAEMLHSRGAIRPTEKRRFCLSSPKFRFLPRARAPCCSVIPLPRGVTLIRLFPGASISRAPPGPTLSEFENARIRARYDESNEVYMEGSKTQSTGTRLSVDEDREIDTLEVTGQMCVGT